MAKPSTMVHQPTKKHLQQEAAFFKAMMGAPSTGAAMRYAMTTFIHLFDLVKPLLNADGSVKKVVLKALQEANKKGRV